MGKASMWKRIAGIAVLCIALTTWASTLNERAAVAVAELTARIQVKRPATAPGQSATLLADGRWLLVGGRGERGRTSGQLVVLDRDRKNPRVLEAHLNQPRGAHSATVLPDGGVLIVGGLNAVGQPIAELERFIPESEAVEAVGDIGLQARASHSATLLMDGRVLIVGGSDVSSLVHRDAQLLDPSTWRVESGREEMMVARAEHSSALLPSDDVVIWGGRDQERQPLNSAELYGRSSGRFSRLEDMGANGALALPYATSAPRVNASIPAANAAGVPVTARVAVRFSKPLAPESLSAETVTLLGPGGPVESTVVAAEGGILLFVTPKLQLLPGTTYTLFVQGAKDPEARALPFTAIKFQTAVLLPPVRRNPPPALPKPEEVLDDADGELWLPRANNFTGVWRSGRAANALQQMPKRDALAKTLYGKRVKNGLPSAPPGVTAVAGQVLKLNAKPLANVTLSIGSQKVVTDGNGEFLLASVSAGVQTMVIDGSTAGKGKRQYGRYEYRAAIESGKTNALPFVIWMTRLDTRNEMTIPAPTASETVVSNPHIPGLELHIPAGTVIRDAAGNIVTQVGMTAIPVDQPPFPLPNSFVPVYFTIQPGGAHLQGLNVNAAKGARLIYPNFSNAKPGSPMDFWNYDSREKGWYVYGQGKVSADGHQIVPDDGVVIYEFTGAMIALPSIAPPEGPVPDCESAQVGDPVDCFTGLFLHERTDLHISDVIPIEVSRSYRPRDSLSRAFGIGTNLSYDLFLIGDTSPWTYQDLILPDGGRVHYARTSPGVEWTQAVYASTSMPGRFFGSTVRWNTVTGTGWLLTLRDGTVYTFPDGYQASVSRCSAPISMKDRNGNTVTFARDSNCNLTTATSPNGRRLAFTYDTSNRIIQVTDDIGRTVTYQYDTGGRLTTATYPDATTEIYTYDAQDRMLTVTDRRSNVMVTNVYDTNGRVSQQTYADNTSSSFAYTLNASNKVTQMDYTNERGVVKRVQFNSSGYVMAVTRALGTAQQQVFSFVRNATTNLMENRTDPLGRVIAYQYDSKGNTTQVTYLSGAADATTWTYTYEPNFSQIATVTDPLNHTATYNYDLSGNLTSVVDALNHTISFTHTSFGQVASATRYVGSSPLTTTYTYVGGDLASVADPLGRTTRLIADPVGRVVTIKNSLGNLTQATYDAFDRVTETIDPLGHTTERTYDGNGNLLTFEDGKSNLTQFSYDVRNRVSSKTDPLNSVESYLYDEIGNRTRVTDRNGQISGYGYDFLDRTISAGFGATTSSPAAFTSTITYTWDAGDRLTDAVDSISGIVSRDFDGLDRLTREQSPQGQIDYTYYANGLRHTLTVQGQSAITYSYDNADRPTQIAQGTTSVGFTYDGIDRRSTLTLPNGIVVTYGYDDASQVISLTYQKDSTTLGTLTYGYDLAGRRTSMGGTLAQVNLPAVIASTVHDAANRVTNWGGHTLTYDDNGALVSDADSSTRTYLWDERRRLKEIKHGATTIASFQYDAFNRRVGKTIGGVGTNLLNDGWQVVQELSGTVPTVNLLTGLRVDEVFRRAAGSTIEDFLTDALGSTIALADAAGTVQSTYSYEPYGTATASGGATDNAYQYTGRENDGDFYYYRNRQYGGVLARFVSEDPIGFAGGSNLYEYANSDPISQTDPLGLWSFSASFYRGVGCSVSFGYDHGKLFVLGDAGVGLGIGASFNPYGGFPRGDYTPTDGPEAFLGFQGTLGATLGPFGIGGTGYTGMNAYFDANGKPRSSFAEGSSPFIRAKSFSEMGRAGAQISGGFRGGIAF